MLHSDIMLETIRKVLPDGLPTDEQVAQMTQEEKEQLYADQKLIMQMFRERSQTIIASMQERLARHTSHDQSPLLKTRSELKFSIPLGKPPPQNPAQPRTKEPRRTRPRVMTSCEKIRDKRPMSLRRLDQPKKAPTPEPFVPFDAQVKEPKRERYATLQDRPRFRL